jgi:hypothetical protein
MNRAFWECFLENTPGMLLDFVVALAFFTPFLMGLFYCPFKILREKTAPLLYKLLLLLVLPILNVGITWYFSFEYRYNFSSGEAASAIGWPIPCVVFDTRGWDYPSVPFVSYFFNFVFYFAGLSFLLWGVMRLHLRFRKQPLSDGDPTKPDEAVSEAIKSNDTPQNTSPEGAYSDKAG